jgi:hypothetical protein
LARQNALGFQYVAQPTLGLFINAAHKSENFRNAFLRHALPGNDLKTTRPAVRPIASPAAGVLRNWRI